MVKRGEILVAKDIAKELNIKGETKLTPNGDTIAHVCAEYGSEKLFHYFYIKLGFDLDI